MRSRRRRYRRPRPAAARRDRRLQLAVHRLADPAGAGGPARPSRSRVVTEPGLNFKVPFIDTVIGIDKRILDLENPAQEVIASDQKRLVVDAFARYRIKDRCGSIRPSARSRAPTRSCRRCSTRRCAACSAR